MAARRVVVVGGGIVGLATAHQVLERWPGTRVTLLEKEPVLAAHQTGRNSGVIHSGIYYKPGSLKARNCRHGKALLEAFCREHGVAMETCGKVIVAVEEAERARLGTLVERGRANGVACELIGRERLREIEPHVAGVEAIHVRETGIVDYVGMCHALARLIEARGGVIRLGTAVVGLAQVGGQGGAEIVVETTGGEVRADALVNCAGLHSDRVTAMSGARPPVKIIPFRGEYFEVRPERAYLCKHLIYPVPDPNFPFLGVHFTRMVRGGVECGPNAVLAFAREGYDNTTVDAADLLETLGYPAFWKIAIKYWRTGAYEMYRSFSKRAFVAALQRLIPEIREEDITPAPAGVRAQALAPDGTLLDDFSIQRVGAMVHVCNAPSPAATSALSIGEAIAEELRSK